MPAEDLPEVPNNILGELVLRGPATAKPLALPEDTYCDDPSDRRERYLPVDGGSVFAALNPPPPADDNDLLSRPASTNVVPWNRSFIHGCCG
jgi:hypothetical protein